MQIHMDTNDPTAFFAITEAGLRAFDRYHRNREARTITLPRDKYHEQTPPSTAQAVAS